ncbi:ubiquitin-associated domain-containing protein 1 [Sabethes cyaneus]|uniref:ubiquitin-associated domain-containing protein 1 n=1 Tax=Sabethes cyaneus TaxID=53552 RepID=UPI00237DF822|nr:ubiquitin-associated domain-containing protein 1 [Sabethes cyaneus]
MIPWMREKIAERKARWQQSRKQQRDAVNSGAGEGTSASTGGANSSPAGSGLRTSTARGFRFSSKHAQQQQQQQQQASTSSDRSKPCGSIPGSAAGCSSSSTITAASSDEEPLLHRRRVIPLRIISPRGGIVWLEATQDCSGKELRVQALERFASCSFSLPHFSSDPDELVARYKLIRARHRTVFHDDDTLEQQGVRAEEEMLLVVKRTDFMPPEENLKGPTVSEVLAATKHIPLSKTNHTTNNINMDLLQSDLQQDLRRILISLARSSAFVIGSGPCADKLIALFRQRLVNRRKHQVRSIETLLEMGFSLDKIHQALEITKNIFPAALDWLIQNDSSVKLLDCDTLSSTTIVSGTASNEATSSGGGEYNGTTVPTRPILSERNIEQSKNTSNEDLSSADPSPTTLEDQNNETMDEAVRFQTKIENVEVLLDIIRQYSDRDVFPAPEMVTSIVEMGFNEKCVREALIATRNNHAAACEWLLGNRSKSLTELRDGLSSDSPILQVLLASPQVQISLGNPKMFIALLSMLDNSSTMTMWLSDNDTSAVLGHILRTYHEEKHIVAINQFSNAQSFN